MPEDGLCPGKSSTGPDFSAHPCVNDSGRRFKHEFRCNKTSFCCGVSPEPPRGIVQGELFMEWEPSVFWALSQNGSFQGMGSGQLLGGVLSRNYPQVIKHCEDITGLFAISCT